MSAIAPVAPNRSLQQRLLALQLANDVRSRRARLKRQLHHAEKRAARQRVARLLTNPPRQVETMKVYDLVIAQPTFGRVKTGNALKAVGISPSKTVGGLSDRQRVGLAEFLRGY